LFLTIWIVSPPLLLILNSLGTNHSLFLSRLYFWNLPAIALLTGGVVSKIKPSKAQQAFFIIFAALVAYGHSLRPWHIEEWRSSAQILRQQSETLPVLLYSGLIENESVAWLENPSNAEYIKTPFMYYQIPQSIRVLPGYLDIPENTSYLKRLLCTELENQKQFLFIALQVRNPSLKTTFIHENILRLIEKLNISVKSLHQNDLISIWLLTRNNTCGVFDTLSANNFK